MPKRMNPELEALRAFCLHVIDFEAERSGNPRGIFGQMREITAQCTQVTGMRRVAADLVEAMQDLRGASLEALDQRLQSAGVPTLSAMRDVRSRRLAGMLLRGRIHNDAEFELLSSHLSDMADVTLTDTQREAANEMLAAYEEAARRVKA